jgi:porin
MVSKFVRTLGVCAVSLASLPLFAADDCETGCGPYRLEARYIHDTWHVPRGGLAQGTANIGKFDVSFQLDGDRAFNLPLTLFARALYDDGGAVSSSLTGDAQTVSNIEAIQAARLFELWSEWNAGGNESLRVGLYDFNSEFDSNGTGSLFINASHGIGKDISQSGRGGPSIFPVSSFGARVRWVVVPGWAMQMAVLDGVPGDPDRPKRTTVRFGRDDGALLAAEVNRAGERLSKIALGSWYYTGHFDRFATQFDAPDADLRTRGSSGVYTLAEMRLYRESPESDRGLAAFVRAGLADADVNRFGRYVGAGLVYTGVLGDDDQVGLALAHATNGGAYRQEQFLGGIATDAAETNVELTWKFGVTSWLTLQPDVQYILSPNTDPTLDDALAVGLRFEMSKALP